MLSWIYVTIIIMWLYHEQPTGIRILSFISINESRGISQLTDWLSYWLRVERTTCGTSIYTTTVRRSQYLYNHVEPVSILPLYGGASIYTTMWSQYLYYHCMEEPVSIQPRGASIYTTTVCLYGTHYSVCYMYPVIWKLEIWKCSLCPTKTEVCFLYCTQLRAHTILCYS